MLYVDRAATSIVGISFDHLCFYDQRNPRLKSERYRTDMLAKIKAFRDQSGATAIEYGHIAAGISVATVSVVNGIGSKLTTKFTSISSQLK